MHHRHQLPILRLQQPVSRPPEFAGKNISAGRSEVAPQSERGLWAVELPQEIGDRYKLHERVVDTKEMLFSEVLSLTAQSKHVEYKTNPCGLFVTACKLC